MKHLFQLIALCLTSIPVKAQASVYTVGPMNAYSIAPTASITPKAGGIIYEKPSATGDINVYISPEIAAAAENVVAQSCKGALDGSCINGVMSTLQNEQRQLEIRSPDPITIAVLVFGVAVAYIYHVLVSERPQPVRQMKIPQAQVSQASQVYASATIFIEPSPSTTVTFVRNPSPTPAPSKVPEVKVDEASGDLVIKMDHALLARTVDLLHQLSGSADCAAAGLRPNKHKRDQQSLVNEALCSAAMTARMAQPEAPMAAFSLMPTILDLEWNDVAVAAAAAQLTRYITSNAPGMSQSIRNGLIQAGPILFAMAAEEFYYNRHLQTDAGAGGEVRIPRGRMKRTPRVQPLSEKERDCTSTTISGPVILAGCTRRGPMEMCSSMSTQTSMTACVTSEVESTSSAVPTVTTQYLPWTILPGDLLQPEQQTTELDPITTSAPSTPGSAKDNYCEVAAENRNVNIVSGVRNTYKVYGKGFGNKDKLASDLKPIINKHCGRNAVQKVSLEGVKANGKDFDWVAEGVFYRNGGEIECMTKALKAYGAPETFGCNSKNAST